MPEISHLNYFLKYFDHLKINNRLIFVFPSYYFESKSVSIQENIKCQVKLLDDFLSKSLANRQPVLLLDPNKKTHCNILLNLLINGHNLSMSSPIDYSETNTNDCGINSHDNLQSFRSAATSSPIPPHMAKNEKSVNSRATFSNDQNNGARIPSNDNNKSKTSPGVNNNNVTISSFDMGKKETPNAKHQPESQKNNVTQNNFNTGPGPQNASTPKEKTTIGDRSARISVNWTNQGTVASEKENKNDSSQNKNSNNQSSSDSSKQNDPKFQNSSATKSSPNVTAKKSAKIPQKKANNKTYQQFSGGPQAPLNVASSKKTDEQKRKMWANFIQTKINKYTDEQLAAVICNTSLPTYQRLLLNFNSSADEKLYVKRILSRRFHPDINKKPEHNNIIYTINSLFHAN
ncbi:MAG: hypothetical protein MHMPM18_001230 [Marteilia pararefringens]